MSSAWRTMRQFGRPYRRRCVRRIVPRISSRRQLRTISQMKSATCWMTIGSTKRSPRQRGPSEAVSPRYAWYDPADSACMSVPRFRVVFRAVLSPMGHETSGAQERDRHPDDPRHTPVVVGGRGPGASVATPLPAADHFDAHSRSYAGLRRRREPNTPACLRAPRDLDRGGGADDDGPGTSLAQGRAPGRSRPGDPGRPG